MSTASRAPASTKPWSSAPVVTVTTPARGRPSATPGDEPARRRRARASTSTARSAGPWPSVTTTTPPAVGEPAARRRRPRARCRRGTASAGRRRRSTRRHGVDARSPARPVAAAASASMPNGLSVHHGRPALERVRRGPRRASGTTAAPRSIGAVPPPAAAAQLASRNSSLVRDQVVRPGADPLGVAAPARGCPAGSRSSEQLHLVDERRARATPCPRRRCPRRSCRASRPARGCALGRARRARARTSSVSSSSRHGGAHSRARPISRERWSATANAADLLDVVAPELHPQRVLLGRREDVEDAAAHGELAALLDQVDAGVRRVRQAGARRPRGRRRRPARSSTGSRSPSPLTCGCSTDRTGATTTASGPLVVVGAGVRQPAQHGEPAADGVAARAEPLVRQRLPAREVARPAPGSSRRPSAATRSSASRAVAVTASTVRPASTRPATTNGPQRRRAGQVEGVDTRLVGQRRRQGRVGQDGVGESGRRKGRIFHSTTAPGRVDEGVEAPILRRAVRLRNSAGAAWRPRRR